MDGYTILYDGNGVTFGGAWEDNREVVWFKVKLAQYLLTGLDVGYSATAPFFFLDGYSKKYCKQLQRMYETLSGKCVIQDCECGNELKLYFDGRQLKMEGKMIELTVSFTYTCEVDQTILLPLITLLKAYN